MFGPLTWILVALSLVAMVYAVVLAARNKRIDWTVLAMLGVVEVGLIVQLIVGIVQLVGSLIVLPIGAFWALAESSRWGAGALAVACLVIPILELRLHDLWTV